jgi:hypothetical protein
VAGNNKGSWIKFGKTEAPAVACKACFEFVRRPSWIKFGIVGVGVLACYFLWSWTSSFILKGKLERAQMDIDILDKAVKRYYVKKGQFPFDLEELSRRQSDGSPALLEPRQLIDPWGKPYIFESGNTGWSMFRGPHIYSQGPLGENKMIGNWRDDGRY